jgi:hypothetical protein
MRGRDDGTERNRQIDGCCGEEDGGGRGDGAMAEVMELELLSTAEGAWTHPHDA